MTLICPTCSAIQGIREHCCPSAALDEIETLRRERDDLAAQVRALKDENDILEELRSDVMRAAEDQGVYL
ncbi:hypothetical protein [Nocardioides mangrovi]|uniref:Uncharacterized protein n=1 Tax=Nocardioides mangrovi TaxID=2874580 RepID=A0ABS7U9W0_9ACTN|nr:hypothetical protein [Nocardioides mangrovi]MBZ5737511.1 hypothetical protein [Nocardioides mangrovi]